MLNAANTKPETLLRLCYRFGPICHYSSTLCATVNFNKSELSAIARLHLNCLSYKLCIYSNFPNFSRGPQDIEILVGTNLKDGSGGKYYKVEKVIRHEKHDRPRRANDVALIRLKMPIEFNEKVQPIKISAKKIAEGENLLVSGFGSQRVSIPNYNFHQVF